MVKALVIDSKPPFPYEKKSNLFIKRHDLRIQVEQSPLNTDVGD